MAEVVMLVCDVDPKPGELVRRYSVTVEGTTREMDLCDQHAGIFAPSPLPARSRGTSVAEPSPAKKKAAASRRKITTLAEIEAMKKP